MRNSSKSNEAMTYRTVEEYMAELDKRQKMEEAPPAAVFLLGSVFAMLVALVGLNVVNVAAALAVGVASDLSHRRFRGGR